MLFLPFLGKQGMTNSKQTPRNMNKNGTTLQL